MVARAIADARKVVIGTTNISRRCVSMMPIGLLTIGEKAEVLKTGSKKSHSCSCSCSSGKGEHSTCCRVEDMGLRAGQTVEMLRNEGKGPILLKVDNSRIAIDRSMAMKIMVAVERR